MTHAAAFELDAALTSAFAAQFSPAPSPRLRAIKVVLVDEVFRAAGELPYSEQDAPAAFEGVRREFIRDGEACYVVFDEGTVPWMLMSFVPDNAHVKAKMQSATGVAALRKGLGAVGQLAREVQWSSVEDVAYTTAEASEAARKQDTESLMSEVEKLSIEDARVSASIVASGSHNSTQSATGLAFPMAEPARAALARFRDGALGLLVLAIEDELVVSRATAEAAPAAGELAARLEASSPCYVLYRWAHERAAAATSAVLFLYMCPEDAPVKQKMLHASSKGAMLQTIGAEGATVAKSLEGIEPAELSDATLATELYGAADAAAAAPVTMTKAAPRAGGRKLIRKKPAEAAAE
jgi:twinfilin-like protein